MKILLILAVFSIPVGITSAQTSSVASAKYSWINPGMDGAGLWETELFRGQAHDFLMLSMSANILRKGSAPTALRVPDDEECLILVKDGQLEIGFNDSTWSLTKGSIALLMPMQRFIIQNESEQEASFYFMKYTSRQPLDSKRGETAGGSFVRKWETIPFRPHGRGGIRNYFERPTAMCRRFEMHVTTLKEGLKSHEPHTHRAEEIVLVINGETEMQIGEKFYKGGDGDIYFLGSDIPHAIRNDGTETCLYFAFQFE